MPQARRSGAQRTANPCRSLRSLGPASPAPNPTDDCIVRAVIYPSIGIARIGSSTREWFAGPEVTEPEPKPPGFYRDARGALKRQAARFRVYGVNMQGEVIRELSGSPSGRRDHLDGAARQYESRLVRVPTRARHSRGGLRTADNLAQCRSRRSRPARHHAQARGRSPARMRRRSASTTDASWTTRSISVRSRPTMQGD